MVLKPKSEDTNAVTTNTASVDNVDNKVNKKVLLFILVVFLIKFRQL